MAVTAVSPCNADRDPGVRLRDTEFLRLRGSVYADYAGAALYSEKQLSDIFQAMSNKVIGNPHSLHGQQAALDESEATSRNMILEMCNTDCQEYECVFTSGATGGIRMVADSFPWSTESSFAYSRDNHTSIVGVREVAQQAGAKLYVTDAEFAKENAHPQPMVGTNALRARSLFAYPLESNFNGARYPAELSTQVQNCSSSLPPVSNLVALSPVGADTGLAHETHHAAQSGIHDKAHRERISQANADECSAEIDRTATSGRHEWFVLLDAAKACATNPPDLSKHKPAFVVLSCYKIFGYPTGLGALLIRKDAKAMLRQRYFGGGTVEACSADSMFVRRRSGNAGMEHGTVSYLGIAAIPHGFALIQRLGGFGNVHRQACELARVMRCRLCEQRHFNGKPAFKFYTGPVQTSRISLAKQEIQSSVVTFNILRHDGTYVGYREVENLANMHAISLRGGCFCNPGACAAHLGLGNTDIQENFEAGHVCGDDRDLVNGRPTGAVRLSFGLASSMADVDKLVTFFQVNFVQQSVPQAWSGSIDKAASTVTLKGIWVYPIKSCRGTFKKSWRLGQNGLLYDREWALVDGSGSIMTLKRYPQLAKIDCSIDLSADCMTVSAPHMQSDLRVPLLQKDQCPAKAHPGQKRVINLCAESCSGMQVVDNRLEANGLGPTAWFTQATGVSCSLVQQSGSRQMHLRPNHSVDQIDPMPNYSLGFANEAQLLLVNEASLDDLASRLGTYQATSQSLRVETFRPNLLIAGAQPYEEDTWRGLAVGGLHLRQSGLCARCEIICADLETGKRSGSEPLKTLASYRRQRGKINFGVLFGIAATQNASISELSVNEPLEILH